MIPLVDDSQHAVNMTVNIHDHSMIDSFKVVSSEETWVAQVKRNWATDQTGFKCIDFKILNWLNNSKV